MQEIEKILEEIREYANHVCGDFSKSAQYIAGAKRMIRGIEGIIRKHINDGWIPVEDRLPEDVYTTSELYEKWFLITDPFGNEMKVQRRKAVPTGYVWFDGYDSVRVSAWRYIEPYRPERSEGE